MTSWKTWAARLMGCAVLAALSGCPFGSSSSDNPVEAAAAVAPAITTAPAPLTVTTGAAASFSVVATGTATLAYQWQRDNVAIAGATAASYTLASTSLADSGAQFRVLVTNSAGTATSASALLTVADVVVAPSITVAPQAVSTLDGTSSTFSVVADGTGPLAYAWQRNGAAIAGADTSSASYTTPALSLADSGAQYRVTVSNAAGSATSAAATLTVNPSPPTITVAPTSVAVAAGQTASFTATVTGSAPLAYQWQRNGVDIIGATATSYTTAATTLADNAGRYRVFVSNGGGNATSAEATLTVSAAVVAPAIATAPQSVTVQEGQSASFTATATGTAPLSFQWLRNGSAVAGATAASHTTAATTVLADNAARYAVRVTNAAGTVTSADAVLTVQAASSPLIGRAWAPGQLLETDDNAVLSSVARLDDAGHATVVFLKSNGTRPVLYATRGTPNAAGVAPTWSTPVAIDLLNGVAMGVPSSNYDFDLAVAPGGNAVALWVITAPCTATTYNTSGTCRYLVTTRYLAATGAWEPLQQVGSFPSTPSMVSINDRGDVSMMVTGWVRSGTNGYSSRAAVAWRPASTGIWRTQNYASVSLSGQRLSLDDNGNLLLVAEAAQNATTDLVAYRGTMADGLGDQQVLDQRGASAGLLAMASGRNGQQVVAWLQSNGTNSRTLFLAASPSPTGAWVVTEKTALPFGALPLMSVNDQGVAYFYDLGSRAVWRWANGSWSDALNVTTANTFGGSQDCTIVRTGDFLCLNPSNGGGTWLTYDATRQVPVQSFNSTNPGPGYVLGVTGINRVSFSTPLLSVSGIGLVTLKNGFDVLPSATLPAGDGRAISNLWGVFLK